MLAYLHLSSHSLDRDGASDSPLMTEYHLRRIEITGSVAYMHVNTCFKGSFHHDILFCTPGIYIYQQPLRDWSQVQYWWSGVQKQSHVLLQRCLVSQCSYLPQVPSCTHFTAGWTFESCYIGIWIHCTRRVRSCLLMLFWSRLLLLHNHPLVCDAYTQMVTYDQI